MRFEYTISIADLAEARGSPTSPRQASRLRRGLIGWILFVFIGVFLLVLLNYSPATRGAASRPQSFLPDAYPAQNLWTTLTPSLVPATMFLMAMLIGRYQNWKRIRLAKKSVPISLDQTQTKILGLLAVLPIVVFPVIANVPQVAIIWNPTPGEAIWVGFMPWIGLAMCLIAIAPLNRRSGAVVAWFKARSLQRPIRLEVTAGEVETDNGLMQCRWQWAGFSRYRETKNLIILITEDETLLVIPKRAVTESGMLDALYALIQNSIATGEFLPRQSRFPVLPAPVVADNNTP